MKASLFPFLRATYYRWAEVWPQVCSDLLSAPEALSVGDLHVENFGTWRDTDGRLIWGVNDFDEASWLPYTTTAGWSLVRTWPLTPTISRLTYTACNAILKDTRAAAGGHPYVLAEDHPALREMARHRLKGPEKFWAKLSSLAY